MNIALVIVTLLLTSVAANQRRTQTDGRYRQLFKRLSKVSDSSLLNDISTPQGKALDWLAFGDDFNMAPDDFNLYQRYAATVLYYSTDGDNWTHCSSTDEDCGETRMFRKKLPYLSNSTECDWGGLKCNKAGLMVTINLAENNLNGFIPVELQLLKRLNALEMQKNSLHGIFPQEIWAMK
eukprot:11350090-Ditylum_brightwellii.AAC.1